MRRILIFLLLFSVIIIIILSNIVPKEQLPTVLMKLRDEFVKQKFESERKRVDHSKFAILNQSFESPQQVTQACESCHNETSKDIMKGNHWNWERAEYIKGKGIIYLGKRNAVNNFCLSVANNEKLCAKCHIGYGIDNTGRGFTDSSNIDCLVCHDNSGAYAKASNAAGAPAPNVNFNLVAQSVGKPKSVNCGTCHFFGGGGNNVKHGDLEVSMLEATTSVDVHMGVDGLNMQCVDCHTTKNHNISGKLYSLSSMNINRVSCERCHSSTPHTKGILNEHTLKVACQSCHIPKYATMKPTKMVWDWSKAGKLVDGKPLTLKDSLGNVVYTSQKGKFVWANNVRPDYVWFNGTSTHYIAGDKIDDTTKPLVLNQLQGSYDDPDSKIYPVKIHLGKQPFDPVNKILIQPKLYGEKPGEGAFWVDFDWQTASKIGMQTLGLPFSGQITFISTIMYWPVNHMVVKKDNSVKCIECHTRNDSRLAGLSGFYMPGRDSSNFVDFSGLLIIILVFIAVVMHISLRIYYYLKNRSEVQNG